MKSKADKLIEEFKSLPETEQNHVICGIHNYIVAQNSVRWEELNATMSKYDVHTFGELVGLGFKPGDLIAFDFFYEQKPNDWEFGIIGDGVDSNIFRATNCCTKYGNEDKMYLYDLGFLWCGEITHKFRIVTEEERSEYIDACIKAVLDPVFPEERIISGNWTAEERERIVNRLLGAGLIDKERAEALNKTIKALARKAKKNHKKVVSI